MPKPKKIAEPKKKPVVPPRELRPPLEKKPALPPERGIRHKAKMLPRVFLMELAAAIRTAVVPFTHEAKAREVIGTAVSGDATFEIDRVAEKALLGFLKNARMPVAYYSEDAGYTTFTNAQPQNLLIIDPIDGTRAAKSGFEACVISITSTRVIERPIMADADNACVAEIFGDRVFYAERGKGTRIIQGEHAKRPKLSKNANLELLSWTMTVPGRPAELIFPTAAKLMDLSSLKGGFFACNSTSYSLTRLLTNQLDACVDFANRYLRDIPSLVKDHFINAGRGVIVGIQPYDLAAALLIAQEAGCTVTDAYGKSFDDLLLLDTSVENQRSMIGASNPQLHQKLLQFFDRRITQWEELLRRRAERAAAAAAQAASSGR
jgi:myo-inositol-1(or 4)-monophosphatase